MKLSGFAAAAALALAPMAAGAVTATVVDHSVNDATNDADVYAALYGAYTPAGGTWGEGGLAPIVSPPPADESGVYKSPFSGTDLGDSTTAGDPTPGTPDRDYFSVGGTDADGEGSVSPRTLTFGSLRSSFSLLWGSIDSYNTLKFENTGGGFSASYTGDAIVDLFDLAALPDSNGNYDLVALIDFAFGPGEGFDRITFSSEASDGVTDVAAFEFATPVPVPMGALLIGTAFLGAGFISRRRKSAS
jgi:hypothetical protein